MADSHRNITIWVSLKCIIQPLPPLLFASVVDVTFKEGTGFLCASRRNGRWSSSPRNGKFPFCFDRSLASSPEHLLRCFLHFHQQHGWTSQQQQRRNNGGQVREGETSHDRRGIKVSNEMNLQWKQKFSSTNDSLQSRVPCQSALDGCWLAGNN